MKIDISDHRRIYTIQKEFSEQFPFLKIEFFAKPHTSGGAASKKIITQSSKKLGTCRTIHHKGSVGINPEMSVRELCQVFNDEYGLTIKVSRLYGNNWVDAGESDALSLEKQNKEGQQSIIIQPE